jgi:hypothetical protein
MSYDPRDYDSEPPPENVFSEPLPPLEDPSDVRQRVQAPAICLIVVGILNLFGALYMLANGILWTVGPDFILDAQKNLPPAFQNPGAAREEQQMQGMLISYPIAFFGFLASVLPIFGGIRMMSLKSYALSICGAICAMVPCISCTACCGAGEAIGIWALVVLLKSEVKSAFQ